MTFEDFKITSKSEWIEKIISDLKGKSISDCYSSIDQKLNLEPFATQEDVAHSSLLPLRKQEASWLPYLRLNTQDKTDEAINKSLLEHLNNGFQAVALDLHQEHNLNAVFDSVFLNMVYSEIFLNSVEQVSQFTQILESQASRCKGYIRTGDIEIDENHALFQGFHLASVHEQNEESLVNALLAIFNNLIDLLDRGMAPHRIRIDLRLDDKTLRNVIKIRAIRMLWNNLLDNYGLAIIPAFILASGFDVLKQLPSEFKLIAASNMATSAAIAGADMIELFSRSDDFEMIRLGVNMHHLLKLESKMDKLQDPLCGSYAIEKASIDLANLVWNKL